MKVALLALIGLVLGLLLGAVIGVGAGLAYTSLAGTTSFEGYSSMLVFFKVMPIGALLGGLSGAVSLGRIAARSQ